MKNLIMIFCLVCFVSANTQADQSKYMKSCASCHGAKGEGNKVFKAPSIAGLDATYIERQLKNFKNGVRGQDVNDSAGQIMAAMSKALTPKSIHSLSRYLSNQPFVSAKPSNKSAGLRGAGLFRSCQSCHGARGQGEARLSAPRIAGQHIWYLKTQLENFSKNIRGSHSEDKFGKQMQVIAQGLTNKKNTELILIQTSHLKPAKETTPHSVKGH